MSARPIFQSIKKQTIQTLGYYRLLSLVMTWYLTIASPRRVKPTQGDSKREGTAALEATVPDSGFPLKHTSRLQ